MTNGEQLRQLRLQGNWTQAQLSEKLHVAIRTVQRWENGARACPDLVVMLVERFLQER